MIKRGGIYLSTSFAANPGIDQYNAIKVIKESLTTFDVDLLTYAGPGWGESDMITLKAADILILIPPANFPKNHRIGRGQYEEINRFYDKKKGGYKVVYIMYYNGKNWQLAPISSCVRYTGTSENYTDNYAQILIDFGGTIGINLDIIKILFLQRQSFFQSIECDEDILIDDNKGHLRLTENNGEWDMDIYREVSNISISTVSINPFESSVEVLTVNLEKLKLVVGNLLRR